MARADPARAGLTVRCAIYTRKSSDEGLEQEFNSLDAQREACEAYIVSQRHAGWVALADMYDDGGLSGGTMERPALERLLEDIKAGTNGLLRLSKNLPHDWEEQRCFLGFAA
jgi:site-specific DNA recombinase